MAAYAAVISLSNTIDRLLNHNQISISPEQKQQLLSLLEHANSFEAFLEEFPDKFNSLEGRIKDLAHEAEDIIEYFMSEQVSSFQTNVIKLLLEKKIKNIHSKEYEPGADSPAVLGSMDDFLLGSMNDFVLDSSSAPPICKYSKGDFEDLVIDLKDDLCRKPTKLQVIPIYGRRGIGKTTLAKYLYHDPLIMEHFEIRVWIKVSQDDSPDRILSSILESLEEYTKVVKGQSYYEKVSQVYSIFWGRRYLIVMDDIWRRDALDTVTRVIPDTHNGSCVMLTTLSYEVASTLDIPRHLQLTKLYEMVLLNEDEGWDLLKWKVFGDEEYPSELENIGKDIARSCGGWPLALVMIAGILSATTRTWASWKEWAEEYRDEYSRSCEHQLHLEKVMEEIGLIAGEVRKIKDAATSAAVISLSLADSIINNSNTVQFSAPAPSPGKVTSMKKNNIKEDLVQLNDSSSSSNGVRHGAALSSSPTAPLIHKDAIVGFEDYVLDLKNRLCGEPSKKLQVVPICGMGGIGKTTLARNVYDDLSILSHFDVHVWVTISQDYSAQRILSSIMESLEKYNKGVEGQSDDEKVHKILKWRRYLVVMDDIWSTEAWDVVSRVFPDDSNGSCVMLTTRLSDVASYPDPLSKMCEMSLLNEDESWSLLKQNVFGDEDCPSELQDIGKKIARSCKGLPLAIVVIAGVLSTTKRSLVSWKVIAENVKSEHDQIEEILALSYVHLPQYLRPCFLYMGSFPEDHEIDVLKLIRLWIAEGFLKSPIDSDSFEKVAEGFLEELVKRNLVLVAKREWDGRIQRCSLHDLMRDLCIKESHKSKFFLNTKDSNIGNDENVRNERRVSIYSSNVEFFSSSHGSTFRSIKCIRHPYSEDKLDFLENVRLLRVLDAGQFKVSRPVHLDELFHLRYLAIRSHGTFPLSFSRLQNLQTLVIHGIYYRGSFELKWCMSQLRHVYCHCTIEFEDPKETDCPLESLQTLCCNSLSTYRETILKMIPNLKELRIDCSEGLPSDGGVCLYDLVHLRGLETLEIYTGFGRINNYKITFPRMLKKLILSRCTLPWNDIFVFGSFPNLQVLKFFYFCTCVGGTWKTVEGAFPVLEVLKISCLNLENWETESSHFPRLKLLQIHYCEHLSGIPSDIGEIPTLQLIEVKGFTGSSKSMIESLELIREQQEEMGNDTLQVVYSENDFHGYDDDDSDSWFQ